MKRSDAFLSLVLVTLVCGGSAAQDLEPSQPSLEKRIQSLIPNLEAYIASGMKAFDVPGLAIGIVAGDKLIFAKGFGVRSKAGEEVDTRAIFQIGSTTKAFSPRPSPSWSIAASCSGATALSISTQIFS